MTNSFYKISLDIHDHGSHVSLKAKKGDSGVNITAPGYYAL